jgi:hypothetical protein
MFRHRMAQWLAVTIVGLATSSAAKADIVNEFDFATPTGAMTGGGPVNATATFKASSAGTLTITLTNLQANPKDVAQCISAIFFTISSGALTGATETGSVSKTTFVAGDGSHTAPIAASGLGWVFSNPTLTTGGLDVLGGSGPKNLIIGPPGAGDTYSNANSSIAGNGPHNPFLFETATFTITGPNISNNTQVTAATFQFGTTPGADQVPSTLTTTPVPAPPALVLGLIGVAGLFGKRVWALKRTPEMA